MKKNICGNCLFWDKSKDNFGWCDCPKLGYDERGATGHNSDELVYWDGEAYRAYVMTGKDFGCVHFEKRGKNG